MNDGLAAPAPVSTLPLDAIKLPLEFTSHLNILYLKIKSAVYIYVLRVCLSSTVITMCVNFIHISGALMQHRNI